MLYVCMSLLSFLLSPVSFRHISLRKIRVRKNYGAPFTDTFDVFCICKFTVKLQNLGEERHLFESSVQRTGAVQKYLYLYVKNIKVLIL